ncbi:porin [Pseudotabrizicola sp. L79]|uniref:porin n=1 Tax=Pseudotabrizicola sp. L79 TaxID=3118402 RepID=UPI002F92A86F
MKKILLASTVLAMTGTVAAAEVTLSGAAGMGLQYNSETVEKSKVFSYATLVATMSGESDSGLSFGAVMNIKVENNGGLLNDDTTVFMSGAFGKLSMGAVGEADEVAGLSDIGWDGLDVDDVAESVVGDELGDLTGASLAHNVNYTYSVNGLTFSMSGRLNEGFSPVNTTDSYAVGFKYSTDMYYVGLGHAQHDAAYTIGSEFGALAGVAGTFDSKVTSLYAGADISGIKVAGLYAKGDHDVYNGAGVLLGTVKSDSFGLNASYTMDAITVSAGYGMSDFKVAGTKVMQEESYGLGASYDLGGGASIKGGIAKIKSLDESQSGLGTLNSPVSETRADLGMLFSF